MITGAVLSYDNSMTKIYEKITSLIDTSKYSVSSPLDTMKFDGSDIERYKRAMNLLKDTKLVITEMSNISTGQGMELQDLENVNMEWISKEEVLNILGEDYEPIIKESKMADKHKTPNILNTSLM